MGNGSNLGTKTVLGASKHQIADHVAGNSLRAGRDVPKCLSVAAIQTEGHFNSFVVPATDLESIGTPTQIAFQSSPDLHVFGLACRYVVEAASHSPS